MWHQSPGETLFNFIVYCTSWLNWQSKLLSLTWLRLDAPVGLGFSPFRLAWLRFSRCSACTPSSRWETQERRSSHCCPADCLHILKETHRKKKARGQRWFIICVCKDRVRVLHAEVFIHWDRCRSYNKIKKTRLSWCLNGPIQSRMLWNTCGFNNRRYATSPIQRLMSLNLEF